MYCSASRDEECVLESSKYYCQYCRLGAIWKSGFRSVIHVMHFRATKLTSDISKHKL